MLENLVDRLAWARRALPESEQGTGMLSMTCIYKIDQYWRAPGNIVML